jgi:hypothetical protein
MAGPAATAASYTVSVVRLRASAKILQHVGAAIPCCSDHSHNADYGNLRAIATSA